jgi:hypothetical protein
MELKKINDYLFIEINEGLETTYDVRSLNALKESFKYVSTPKAKVAVVEVKLDEAKVDSLIAEHESLKIQADMEVKPVEVLVEETP